MDKEKPKIGCFFSIPACIIFLLYFFPVGLILIFIRLYKTGKISKRKKNLFITADVVLFVAMVVLVIVTDTGTSTTSTNTKEDTPSITEQDLADGQDQPDEPVRQVDDTSNTPATTQDLPIPTAFGRNDFSTISAGDTFAMVIDKNGTLWGWGYNDECRLGSSSFSEDEKIQYTPIMIFDKVVSMSMGRSVACAIRTDHSLWAWSNDPVRGNPKIVAENVISACVVYKELTFIKEDHTLWSINDLNTSSAKHIADHVIDASPVDGGIIYLTSDGILYGLGYNSTYLFANNETGNVNTPIVIMEDIVSFSVITNTGSDFAVAITSDGTLYGWGCNNSGQLGNHRKGDMKDALGNTICTTPIIIDHNVAAASCGLGYTLILKSNGELYACGTNTTGRLGIGEENGNEYNEEYDIHYQTIPTKVMDGIMLPSDNSALYDRGPVYSIWEGTYYGKKSDFKDYIMSISYGMNDGRKKVYMI